MIAQLADTVLVQRSGPRPEFATIVPAKVINSNPSQVSLTEGHGLPLNRRLCQPVDLVDEHAEPLISCAVRIDGSSNLRGALDLDSMFAGLHAIVRILSLYQKVRMTIVKAILHERPRMLGDAGCEHVGHEPGEDCASDGVFEAGQTLPDELRVDIEEEVVHVLHGRLEVDEPELVRQHGSRRERLRIHLVPLEGHASKRKQQVPTAPARASRHCAPSPQLISIAAADASTERKA